VTGTSRTQRLHSASKKSAARPRVQIAIPKGGGLFDGTVYIGTKTHQTCHGIASLYSHEPLALDLARVMVQNKSSCLLRESVATALAAIAAETNRPRCRS